MYAGPEIQGTQTREVEEYVGPGIQDHSSFGSRLLAQDFLAQVVARDFLDRKQKKPLVMVLCG